MYFFMTKSFVKPKILIAVSMVTGQKLTKREIFFFQEKDSTSKI